jgi:flagellar motor switch protein FliG
MKTFIWKELDNVSSNYHSGGGLVVIAETLKKAKEIAEEDVYIKIDKKPDYQYEGGIKEKVFVFPDAGCC